MIALALACRPQLLIADEPTTGLDVTTQAAVMDLITGLARERHMATLFITHDLALAADHCDRIVVMHAGHAVESAPTPALFAAPRHPYTARLMSSTPGARQQPGQPAAGARQPARPEARRPAGLPLCRALRTRHRALPSRAAAPAGRCRARGGLLASAARACPRAGAGTCLKPCCRWNRCTSALPVQGRRGALLHAVDDVSLHIGAGRERWGWWASRAAARARWCACWRGCSTPAKAASSSTGRSWPASRRSASRAHPLRAAIQMVFQDPTDSLNPRFSARQAIAEPLRLLQRLGGRAAGRARRRGGAAGGPAAGVAAALCAPAVGRAEGARGHRPRAGTAAAAADPGRAHRGAGRVGAGGGAATAGRAAPRAGPELPVRVARPERGAAADRPRGGDVPGQDRRGRARPKRCSARRGTPTPRRWSRPSPARARASGSAARWPARSTRRPHVCRFHGRCPQGAGPLRARGAAAAPPGRRARSPATLPHDARHEPLDRDVRATARRARPTWPSRSTCSSRPSCTTSPGCPATAFPKPRSASAWACRARRCARRCSGCATRASWTWSPRPAGSSSPSTSASSTSSTTCASCSSWTPSPSWWRGTRTRRHWNR